MAAHTRSSELVAALIGRATTQMGRCAGGPIPLRSTMRVITLAWRTS